MYDQNHENFARMTFDHLREHHKKYYVGANTEIIISGPIKDVLQMAETARFFFDCVPRGSEKIEKKEKSLTFHSGEMRISEERENVDWGLAFSTDM